MWGVGLATKKCDLNKVPLGNNSESWVLRSDGSVAHNGIIRHRIREVPEEGDMIVSTGLQTVTSLVVNYPHVNCSSSHNSIRYTVATVN